MRPLWIGLIVGALSFAGRLHADETEVRIFQPSTLWNIDYAEEFCRLRRSFVSGENSIHLELRQYAPGSRFDLLLFTDWDKFDGRDFTYRFSNDLSARGGTEPVFDLELDGKFAGLLSFGVWAPARGEEGQEVVQSPEIQSFDDWAKSVESLVLERRGRSLARLDTGPLNEVQSAMGLCLDELITHWGIDAAAHKTLLSPVEPKQGGKLARKITYPKAALLAGDVGVVNIRLLVDRTGTPTDCTAVALVSDRILEDTTCRSLMRYNEFSPAIAADGKTIDSYWSNRVSFIIK